MRSAGNHQTHTADHTLLLNSAQRARSTVQRLKRARAKKSLVAHIARYSAYLHAIFDLRFFSAHAWVACPIYYTYVMCVTARPNAAVPNVYNYGRARRFSLTYYL